MCIERRENHPSGKEGYAYLQDVVARNTAYALDGWMWPSFHFHWPGAVPPVSRAGGGSWTTLENLREPKSLSDPCGRRFGRASLTFVILPLCTVHAGQAFVLPHMRRHDGSAFSRYLCPFPPPHLPPWLVRCQSGTPVHGPGAAKSQSENEKSRRRVGSGGASTSTG